MQQRLPEPTLNPAGDIAACRALLRNGSRTFYAASFLLPRDVRESATALYAFCRIADDIVDNGGEAKDLARLRDRLDLAYLGRPLMHSADRAFANVVARYAIPRAVPEALIEGFEWDASCRRYETIADLKAYAARVAGTVGVMMAILMGARSEAALARASDLGMAMQLTNIARDVGEDARAGRIYLPLGWMRDAGVDPDRWLAAPRYSSEIGHVVEALLRVADELYTQSMQGIALLPPSCRPGIHAARLLYSEIGQEVRRRGLDSVSQRAVVPRGRKAWGLMQAIGANAARSRSRAIATDPAARFLVDAVLASPAPALVPHGRHIPWWNVDGRVGSVIDLFERLEREERASRGREALAAGRGGVP